MIKGRMGNSRVSNDSGGCRGDVGVLGCGEEGVGRVWREVV